MVLSGLTLLAVTIAMLILGPRGLHFFALICLAATFGAHGWFKDETPTRVAGFALAAALALLGVLTL